MTDATTPPSPAGEPGAHERPYQSLYRRYRPQRFDEVRGQDHVTRALRNAVRDERIAHAYLFSGPRGTGKTSTARILAKALNCTAPADGEPCGDCESCVSIVAGSSFDVHELDAASNNGVDAMRDLVARASLATPGRWKVYIVDEVHMLSTAASNALLKTLEEPPEHVVFVLATTDPQKVLPTIRSRTQHYEFHLLADEVLEGLLADVATDAGLELPDGGISVALRRGRGSARDALSMLDQVAASGSAEDDSDTLSAVVAGIAERDVARVLAALDDALRGGREAQQLAVELVERLRSGFLSLVAPGVADHSRAAASSEEARSLGTARCVRAMEVVGTAIVAMRDAPEPRITLEVALSRLAHPEADDSLDAVLDRMQQLERRLEQLERPGPRGQAPTRLPGEQAPAWPPAEMSRPPAGEQAASRPVLGAYRRPRDERNAPAPAASPAGPSPEAAPASPDGSTLEAAPARPPAPREEAAATVTGGPDDLPDRDALVAAWGDHVITALRPKVRAYFQAGRFVGTDGADALFALPNAVHVSQAAPMRDEVAAALSRHFGRQVGLRLVVDGEAPGRPDPDTVRRPRPDAPQAATSPGGRPRPRSAPGPVARPPATVADDAPAAPAAEAIDDEIAREIDDTGPLEARGEPASGAPDTGLSWAEGRLLEAFPGAEEV